MIGTQELNPLKIATPRRSKPPGPKGGGADKPTHRGSVPKVPLVKV